ncbi:MAG: NADH:flavin oxidoreductase/NADH oxidase [Ornithinimicrobium sp.]|uniref:NADH:flavin oxidoreductase/NADH oxidase n=1 Tax=Ornithinimicrobium sp. TaxID=1977084 RepID=UPI0026DF54D4|nr:NADH:flavin oxidoreductase/NADH oxidase [Ornithinimicrobium sp.]MDO5739048.1 NADH:flavin oxidoreductase/NADH oxidase [Ornithinimicrobium sp.]
MSASVFDPITIGALTLPGRVWVSPMCQYSCRPSEPGYVTDWHLVHLMSFAVGGAPLIFTEATAVKGKGRISPWDAGLWQNLQISAWHRIIEHVHELGSKMGVQLSHAGRKGSVFAPFHEESGSVPRETGGWTTVGPSAAPFGSYAPPRRLSVEKIAEIVQAFVAAAHRAVLAGFDVVEIHAAHGYLLAQFLSPLVNDRDDEYGGSDAGRARMLFEVTEAVRKILPARIPLLVRVSATDWSEQAPGGVEGDLARTIEVAKGLQERGADLVDVSTGGNLPSPKILVGPGYQVRFAEAIRREISIPVSTVGMITTPGQAQEILAAGRADVVMLARAALADPHWWHRAAHQLGHELAWPPQYSRILDRHVYAAGSDLGA